MTANFKDCSNWWVGGLDSEGSNAPYVAFTPSATSCIFVMCILTDMERGGTILGQTAHNLRL